MKFKATFFLILLTHLLITQGLGQWGYNGHRIAISSDGNSAPDYAYKWPIGDPDDWAANAAILAMLAKLKMKNKLVHFSYNNFIDAPAGPDDENQNKLSCDGGISRWNFDRAIFFDVTKQQEEAKVHLANEMAKSTASDPLYFLHAGLSEFVFQAVEKAIDIGGLEALSYVKLISHSGFNENEKRREWHRDWSDIQKLCGQRIQYYKIKDQNACNQPDVLWCSGKDFSPWFWMRDHKDENIRWLYTRMEAHQSGKADMSDVGMLYWLLTGDENGSPEKFQSFIGQGIPNTAQKAVSTKEMVSKFTLYADKDFNYLDKSDYEKPYVDHARRAMAIDASKHQNVFAVCEAKLIVPKGLYNIKLTSLMEIDGESTYQVFVNGVLVGKAQNPTTDKDYKSYKHTFLNVRLEGSNEIKVVFNSHSNQKIPEGNSFAFARGRWTKLDFEHIENPKSQIITINSEEFQLQGHWKTVHDTEIGRRYITYFGSNHYHKVDPKETIVSRFEVTNPGVYTVKWYMRQPADAEGDKSNDVWIDFSDAIQMGDEPIKGFHKFVGRGKHNFKYNGQLDLEGDQPWMKVRFDKPGFYTLKLSGRSEFLQIEKIILYKGMTFEEARSKTRINE